jgi:serine/threonine-protein kinase RsbW
LPSQIESVDTAAEMAAEFVRAGGYGDEFVYAIDLAIRESVANAVKHGNKFDENKKVELTLSDVEGGVEVSIRDFGAGFAPEDIPDPTDPENLLKSNGRGILFMRSFMDEVEWSNAADGGSIVRMRKQA